MISSINSEKMRMPIYDSLGGLAIEATEMMRIKMMPTV